MSIGANPSGIAPRVAPPPVKQVQANQNSQANQSARQAAMAQANANSAPAPALAASTAVSMPGSAPAVSTGGTTAPASAPRAAAPQAASVMAAAMSMAAMSNPAALGALFAAAATSKGSKASDISGKDDSVDRAKETEADEKNMLALKDSNSETGNEAGDISGANSAGGPST